MSVLLSTKESTMDDDILGFGSFVMANDRHVARGMTNVCDDLFSSF